MIHSINNCTEKDNWKLAKIKSIATNKAHLENRISEYNKNPKECKHCGNQLSYADRNKTFCNRSCAASFNNKGLRRNDTIVGHSYFTGIKVKRLCEYCETELVNVEHVSRFCSKKCSNLYKKRKTIMDWKESPEKMKRLTYTIRKYILNEAHNKCCKCGWDKINQYSGNYALIVDHIDGNSENNVPENLRVLCPNCDSLLPTYKALNKGNGRAYRRARYSEGKSY